MQPDQDLPAKVESNPNKAPVTPESLSNVESTESAPAQAEQQPGISSLPQPVVPAANQPTSAPIQSATGKTVDPTLASLPAADVDTIEKVWIEKTNQIKEQKKDDPQAEDDAQHDLSRAYLKKRFNLDVE